MTDSTFYLGRAYDHIRQTVTDVDIHYDPADLTTHAVVTGMTGSGKTGLCVVLLEEATPDPGDYHPEPEWYFLFLFQMLRLKIFAGEFGQFLGAVAIPGAFMALLAALPFIDRSPERNIFKRPIALIGWIVVMATILIFTVSAIINREFLE